MSNLSEDPSNRQSTADPDTAEGASSADARAAEGASSADARAAEGASSSEARAATPSGMFIYLFGIIHLLHNIYRSPRTAECQSLCF